MTLMNFCYISGRKYQKSIFEGVWNQINIYLKQALKQIVINVTTYIQEKKVTISRLKLIIL